MTIDEQKTRLDQINKQLQQAQTQIQTLQSTIQTLLAERYKVEGRIEALQSMDDDSGES